MFDTFEFSKIAGGVLTALLVIFLPKTLIDLAQHKETKGGYELPAADTAAAPQDGGGAAQPAAFDPAQVIAALPTANPENAKGEFRKCLGCHSAEKGAASKAGPNLWGVVGRPHGAIEDFKGYSEPMKSKEGPWTYEELAKFLHAPKTYLPGTRMVYAGLKDPAELADLVAYLRTLSDSPPPLPEVSAAPAADAVPAAPPAEAQPGAAPAAP